MDSSFFLCVPQRFRVVFSLPPAIAEDKVHIGRRGTAAQTSTLKPFYFSMEKSAVVWENTICTQFSEDLNVLNIWMSPNYSSIQLKHQNWWKWNNLNHSLYHLSASLSYQVQWNGWHIHFNLNQKKNFKPGWVVCRLSFITD